MLDPYIPQSDTRWLEINGTPVASADVVDCSLFGEACRRRMGVGFSPNVGGFFNVVGPLNNPLTYHVFSMDLRSGSFAYSSRDGDDMQYYLVHEGNKTPLGSDAGGVPDQIILYGSSRYGAEIGYNNVTDVISYRDDQSQRKRSIRTCCGAVQYS